MVSRFDHRQGRRLRMKTAVAGMVQGGRVDIVDISIDSVGIEHTFPMTLGSSTFLEFSWGQQLMQLSCVVTRTTDGNGKAGHYRSGLKIQRGRSISEAEFRKRVKEALEKLREAEEKLPPAF